MSLRWKKTTAASLIMALLLIVISGCGRPSSGATEPVPAPPEGQNPVATIEMQDGQKIVIELYPDIAPNTVYNFISLANQGFYDGLIFHRVIPGFMIQGGDPNGDGSGGPGYAIKGEFTSNGHKNHLNHTRGVISMARESGKLDSAGSQFFIMAADDENLDAQYASFGKVTEGLDVVDNIVNQPTESDKPVTDQVMKKVTVDTHGLEYPEPVKMPEE
nr:peptidylprolyl isomerase [Paenibacillus xylanexedens]